MRMGGISACRRDALRLEARQGFRREVRRRRSLYFATVRSGEKQCFCVLRLNHLALLTCVAVRGVLCPHSIELTYRTATRAVITSKSAGSEHRRVVTAA